jgi:hypothetical protein
VAKLAPSQEPIDDIEAFVRAAGGYVQPSRDLRPRILEIARLECGERRARRWIRQVAASFVLLAVFTLPNGRGLATADSHYPAMLASVDANAIFSQAESKVDRSRDFSWRMVEAFTDLRHQQAGILRLEL